MRRCRRPIRGLFVVVLGIGLAAAALRVPSLGLAQVGQSSAAGPATNPGAPAVETLVLKAPPSPVQDVPVSDSPRLPSIVLQSSAVPTVAPEIDRAIRLPRSTETPAAKTTSTPSPGSPMPEAVANAVRSFVPTASGAPPVVDVDPSLPPHLRDDAKREAVDQAISVLLNKANQRTPSPATPAETIAPATIQQSPASVATSRDNSWNPVGRLLDRMRGSRVSPPAVSGLPEPPPLPPVSIIEAEEQEPVRSTLRPALSLDDIPKTLPPSLPPPPGSSSPKSGATPPESPPRTAVPPAEPSPAPMETCATCGHRRPFHRLHGTMSGKFEKCTRCGADWRCVPGQEPCGWCDAEGPLGHFLCSIYDSICCIDPCYEPKWRQVPNAAIFVDGARPITQTEVRWNAGRGGVFPDRAEFMIARADGMGRGPRPLVAGNFFGHFNFDELNIITETAKDKISAIIEFPYRAIDADAYPHGAGFGDMGIGTKTLICDCELAQISLMMKTYLPLGNAIKGVGPGHLTLEPSLLFAIKMTSDCYIQGQISESIPIGGDPDYAGSVLHTHFSVNNVLYRFGPDFPLVGTFETSTYSFQDGAYTDPVLGPYQPASRTTYVSLGPGLRLMFCDRVDIGFGAAIAVSGDHFAREYYRTSVRLRF